MNNIFRPYKVRHSQFSFGRLGDIDKARATLGNEVPIQVYRLMLHTMSSTLIANLGVVQTRHFFREAGRLAGSEMLLYRLLLEDPPEIFMESLTRLYHDLKLGNLRVESYDPNTKLLEVVVDNEILCGGLSEAEDVASYFDEGLLCGIMEAYTDGPYQMERTDRPGWDEVVGRYSGRPME